MQNSIPSFIFFASPPKRGTYVPLPSLLFLMELISVIWQFLLLWIFIYIFVFLIQFFTTKNPGPRRATPHSVLPTFSISSSNEVERDQWSIKLFQVKYTTHRLNSFFQRLTQLAPWFWKAWFHIGALAASVTMVVGMAVIVYAGLKILSSLTRIVSVDQSQHVKRELVEPNNGDEQVFLPMVKSNEHNWLSFLLIPSYSKDTRRDTSNVAYWILPIGTVGLWVIP